MSQPEPLYCAASLSLFHSHTHKHTHSFTYSMPWYSFSLPLPLSVLHTHSCTPSPALSFCLTSAARLICLSSILLPLCVPTLHHLSVVLTLPLPLFFIPKCSSVQLSPIFFIILPHSFSFSRSNHLSGAP